MLVKSSSSPASSSPAAERIRVALKLEVVNLPRIPEDTLEKLAEISETTLSRFPRKLRGISDDIKRCGGIYYGTPRQIKICPTMTTDDTMEVFVHEIGHALHYAICDHPASAKAYTKFVTAVRDDNIRRLTGICWKAIQEVPSLKDLFYNHKYANLRSVRDMYDRMQSDKQLIPEHIFDEFQRNLFSRYSLKNLNEYFCETFTCWLISPAPSEFARTIGILVERHALIPANAATISSI